MGFVCSVPRTLASGQEVRCGKCAECVDLRGWLKRQVIGLEVVGHAGERCWFGSLTFRDVPEEGDGYDAVQKFIKRLRKGNPDARFRYVAVREYGSRNKRLHYHLVVFCDRVLKYREIPEWGYGFSRWKIADEGAWEYVVKYIQKQGGAKVRGSTRLGRNTVEVVHGHPLVDSFLRQFSGAVVARVCGFKVPRSMTPAPVATKLSDSDLDFESVESRGISDALWNQWMKSTGFNSGDEGAASTARRPSSYIPLDLFEDLGNRGDAIPEECGGPDGS